MNDTAINIMACVLSGGVGVAIVNGIVEWLKWKRDRKAAKQDEPEEKIKQHIQSLNEKVHSTSATIDALKTANKYILYDRIRYLGQAYIAEGEIDFDDRRILNDMHDSYHNGLDGNGDLDNLMAEVNKLPLKINKIKAV